MSAQNKQWVQEVDQRLRDMITKHGLAVMGTFMEDGCPFLHTIGLQAHELPELVIVGMPVQQSYPLIDAVGRWCINHADDLIVPGREWVVPSYNPDLTWRAGAVSKRWCKQNMNKMTRFYPRQWRPGRPGSVIQVIWPNRDGIYPGPLWPDRFGRQPLLANWEK